VVIFIQIGKPIKIIMALIFLTILSFVLSGRPIVDYYLYAVIIGVSFYAFTGIFFVYQYLTMKAQKPYRDIVSGQIVDYHGVRVSKYKTSSGRENVYLSVFYPIIEYSYNGEILRHTTKRIEFPTRTGEKRTLYVDTSTFKAFEEKEHKDRLIRGLIIIGFAIILAVAGNNNIPYELAYESAVPVTQLWMESIDNVKAFVRFVKDIVNSTKQ
jgi:hypothetical protein